MLRDQFDESIADALAARRASQTAGRIAVAWIGFGTVVAAVLGWLVHPAGWAGALLGSIFVVVAIATLRIQRIRALADPLPLRVGIVDGLGMSTDRSTYLSWAMVTVILGVAMLGYWDVSMPTVRWGMGLFSLAMIGMLMSVGLPGIGMRRRKWEILAETLRTNPEAAAKYAEYRGGR